jgi:subtilisin family serine protease
VAASSFGVAPKARILPVRVLAFDAESKECVGRPDDVAAGIRWAVANGARVLNLSLGPDVPGLAISSSILRAVDTAADAGAVVVFSAGNASLPITDAYGSAALIVAATGPNGSLASYSQRGAGVDLAAPGGDPRTPGVCSQQDCVTSLFPNGRYSVAAGTSMAAPHVSGVAALLYGQNPARTRDQVIERLLSTARPLADAGRGMLDARAALGVGPNQPTLAQAGAPPEQVTAPASPAPAPPPAASPAPAPANLVAAPVAPPAAVTTMAPPVGAPAAPAPTPADPAAVPAEQPMPVAAPGAPTGPVPVPIWTAALAAALLLLAGGGTVAAARGHR